MSLGGLSGSRGVFFASLPFMPALVRWGALPLGFTVGKSRQWSAMLDSFTGELRVRRAARTLLPSGLLVW